MNDDPPTREVTLCTSRPGSRADAVQEEGGWTPTAGMARSPCGADDASRREPGRDRRWGLGRGHRPSVQYGQQVSSVERVFTIHNRVLQRPKTLSEPQRSMTS